MNEIKDIILGANSMSYYIGYAIWSLVGAFLYHTFLDVKGRNVNSSATPIKFNFLFLLKDNWKRYLTTILIIFVQIKFYKELNGVDLTAYTALLLGFTSDGISDFAKRSIPALQTARDKV